MMTVGQRVKELRLERGWTQQQLAQRAEMNFHTIQNTERGRRAPMGLTITALAKTFGVTRRDLTGEPLEILPKNVVVEVANLTPLKLFRIQQELTLDKMGEKLGVSKERARQLEQAKSLQSTTCQRLSIALGVPVEYFFGKVVIEEPVVNWEKFG